MITTIITAYIMDLILGDPPSMPHPVKIMGAAIKKLEPPLRRLIRNQRLSGTLLALIIISFSWLFPFIAIQTAASIHKYLSFCLSVLFIYNCLSIKDLKTHSLRVYNALKNKNIALARQNLSMMVGRDTRNLNEEGVIRASVETISENTVDGIISPLLFAFIGGAPLALAYKAINTLDSMIGHKNKRYKDFGWASAKIDDLANFIPARISALLIPVASWLIGQSASRSWQLTLRDGRKNPSPNSGIPQAAIAGALGIQLGGGCSYNLQPVVKPIVGDKINLLNSMYILKSIQISYICSILSLIAGGIFLWLIR